LLAVLFRCLAVYMRRPVLYFGRLPVGFVHDASYIRPHPSTPGAFASADPAPPDG
jgi:hypothetical protein